MMFPERGPERVKVRAISAVARPPPGLLTVRSRADGLAIRFLRRLEGDTGRGFKRGVQDVCIGLGMLYRLTRNWASERVRTDGTEVKRVGFAETQEVLHAL